MDQCDVFHIRKGHERYGQQIKEQASLVEWWIGSLLSKANPKHSSPGLSSEIKDNCLVIIISSTFSEMYLIWKKKTVFQFHCCSVTCVSICRTQALSCSTANACVCDKWRRCDCRCVCVRVAVSVSVSVGSMRIFCSLSLIGPIETRFEALI